MSILTVLFSGIGMMTSSGAILASYEFPAVNSIAPTVVGANVTVSDIALSSSTLVTNQTAGSYFPNEPYIQGTGWTAAAQTDAKSFFITITAVSGYAFNIENIAFNAYVTGAGPSAIGISVGTDSVWSASITDSVLHSAGGAVTGQTGLTSATIKVQGWLNGSRTSSGGGDFRIDDLVVNGTVMPIPEPSSMLLGVLGGLGLLRRRR